MIEERDRARRGPCYAFFVRAMVLREPGSGKLEAVESRRPEPGAGQLLVRVAACGVCRTDRHVVDGELPDPALPLVPGHEIVGRVEALGPGAERFAPGERVGVAWLGWSCGRCRYCRSGRENLCRQARFTGYTLDGGYAGFVVADERYVFPLGETGDDAELAPWMCAGLIGYRAYRMALGRVDESEGEREAKGERKGEALRLGLYGFGAAAHILCQLARHEGREVYAYTRPGDDEAQRLALELGAAWAGSSEEAAPSALDAAILFAPVGALVPAALRAVVPGGTVVCAGIHMSDIPSFPYRILWEERSLRSVANLTRRDAEEFLAIAPKVPIRTRVSRYPLDRANEALDDLRRGRVVGAAVLVP
jgi:propanol-preferring alcohol dehydrogenase